MNPNETEDFTRFTILVVDDDAITRNLLILALKQAGYHVEEATNGEEGLRKYKRIQPDLVLLDALMPVMDGFECCQQLREKAESRWPPILMITFLDDNESIDKAFSAGATDYITKPIHWGSLRQRVKTLLDYGYLVRHQDRQRQWQTLTGQFLAHLTAGGDPASLQSLIAQGLSLTQIHYLAVFQPSPPPGIGFAYTTGSSEEHNGQPDWPQLFTALDGYLGEATAYEGQIDPSLVQMLDGLSLECEHDCPWIYLQRFAAATGEECLCLALGADDQGRFHGDRRSAVEQLSSLVYIATAKQRQTSMTTP